MFTMLYYAVCALLYVCNFMYAHTTKKFKIQSIPLTSVLKEIAITCGTNMNL